MNHVDLVLCPNCLVALQTVLAVEHGIDLYLLEYSQQVIFTASLGVEDLASIDRFLGIDRRTNVDPVFIRVVSIYQVSDFLGFDNHSTLFHSDDLIKVDDVVIDLANLGLLLTICQI